MIEILIAVAAVTAVGLVAGILLAVISHFFAVEDDPKYKAVRECLPGVNCGACGYKGCDDYAAALAAGEAKPNLCIPGGNDTTQSIGAVLGIEAHAQERRVAFVHCNGNCKVTTKRVNYDGISTCRAATMFYGGPDSCLHGCTGLGDCAAACPVGAICMKDGIAHINAEACLGCGLCEDTCPRHLITMISPKSKFAVICNNKDKGATARKVCQSACIGCKKCERLCPEQAITVTNNLARIDHSKCKSCGMCEGNCPTGALKRL